jgi:hypothetical protein
MVPVAVAAGGDGREDRVGGVVACGDGLAVGLGSAVAVGDVGGGVAITGADADGAGVGSAVAATDADADAAGKDVGDGDAEEPPVHPATRPTASAATATSRAGAGRTWVRISAA